MSARTITVLVIVALVIGVASRILFPMDHIAVEVAAEELGWVFPEGFTNSMLVALILDVLLIILALAATARLTEVPRGLQNLMEAILEAFYGLLRNINREYVGRAFPVLGTIFLYTLISNWFGLLPGVGSIGICHHKEEAVVTEPAPAEPTEEPGSIWRRFRDQAPGLDSHNGGQAAPEATEEHGTANGADTHGTDEHSAATGDEHGDEHDDEHATYLGCDPGDGLIPLFRPPSADLNYALALALVSMVIVEYFGFASQGPRYLGKFFNLRGGPVGFFVGIFELISEIARIPAFTFRLFGNIFAGEVLLIVMIFLVPAFLPLPFYLFEVFVGFIQAFIFAVLTMAFIGLAVTPHHDDHNGHNGHDGHTDHAGQHGQGEAGHTDQTKE